MREQLVRAMLSNIFAWTWPPTQSIHMLYVDNVHKQLAWLDCQMKEGAIFTFRPLRQSTSGLSIGKVPRSYGLN